jgi:hypothetical protein
MLGAGCELVDSGYLDLAYTHTFSERKAPPNLDAGVDIVGHDQLIVHRDTARAADRLLRGQLPGGMLRTPTGETALVPAAPPAAAPDAPAPPTPPSEAKGTVRIYPYANSWDSLERVIRDRRLDARTVTRPEQAHVIVTLPSQTDDPRLQRTVQATGLAVESVKKNTPAQIRRLLQNPFNLLYGVEDQDVDAAVRDAEAALQRSLKEWVTVELAPGPPSLRRVQHGMASRHKVVGDTVGHEPNRPLIIHPNVFATISPDAIL